jgi:hypothetical protein
MSRVQESRRRGGHSGAGPGSRTHATRRGDVVPYGRREIKEHDGGHKKDLAPWKRVTDGHRQ